MTLIDIKFTKLFVFYHKKKKWVKLTMSWIIILVSSQLIQALSLFWKTLVFWQNIFLIFWIDSWNVLLYFDSLSTKIVINLIKCFKIPLISILIQLKVHWDLKTQITLQNFFQERSDIYGMIFIISLIYSKLWHFENSRNKYDDLKVKCSENIF